MAEIVGSAVVGETLNRITSFLINKHKEKSTATENMERLEMAHIKMEAALETSKKWCIADVSLMRWRKRLKRAAEECDDTLRRCKLRALEEQEIEQGISQSSFSKRIAQGTKSIISSFVDNNHESGSSVVRRFERFADGAGEFLRFVEFGSTPRQYMFFDPLIRHLLVGKALNYEMLRGSKSHYFCVLPVSVAQCRVDAKVFYYYKDPIAPEKNICLGIYLQLSESTDIVGIVVKCLQLVTPHFKSTAEVIMKELISQLPSQDFSYVPHIASIDIEHWKYYHYNTLLQWFRPDPLCCKGHEHMPCSSYRNALNISNTFPESVIQVYLQHHISLSEYNFPRSAAEDGKDFLQDFPPLKVGVHFMPHASSEELHPRSESSAVEIVDGEEQDSMYTNVSLHQLDEMLLPKAIDCLYKTAKATTYQTHWSSKHGVAQFFVEKTRTQVASARKTIRKARNDKVLRHRDPKLMMQWKQRMQFPTDVAKLWVARAPDTVRSSFMAWLRRIR